MSLKTQRRLAAEILGVGINRVKFMPEKINEIKEAITRKDIEELIKEGAIKKRPIKGYKRRAGRKRQKRYKKRRRGEGKIKKKVIDKKRKYIILIRNLRRYLKNLKNRGILTTREYRILRKQAKGGRFKSKKELMEYIKIKLGKSI
ncbi:MAG: 50S ribosomal protein L19e [Candidatus Pacearchaeota archaeon]